MISKVIWSAIFTGLIEIIQHHKPISHSPCRRRYYRALALLFWSASLLPSILEDKRWEEWKGLQAEQENRRDSADTERWEAEGNSFAFRGLSGRNKKEMTTFTVGEP